MARVGSRLSSRGESRYRARSANGASYFTSRAVYGDLAVVLRRFPTAPDAAAGGRPIVLVHGLGTSSRYFHPVAAELAKHTAVYVVDLPGYGSAPKPRRDVRIADHAGVLARFLEAGRIENPVVVGHSMGTQVVTRLAFDHPEVTDKLVLIAPTMDPAARTFRTAAARMLRDIVREPARPSVIVAVDYFIRCGIPYFVRQLPHLFGDHMEDRLPELTASVLVMRGDRDCVSPAAWSRQVAALCPDASYAVVRGPHVIMYTDPIRTAELIVTHANGRPA
jgi:pimeloyl-ACP methyl ester carboxylesterase